MKSIFSKVYKKDYSGLFLYAIILIPILTWCGFMYWGLSMLSDSLEKQWADQDELNFIDQAHQQGYNDSQMLTPHCFGDWQHGFFGDCKDDMKQYVITHHITWWENHLEGLPK